MATHKVTNHLPNGTYTKEIKTLEYPIKQNDYAWTSPMIEYKDGKYFIGTNDYVTYVAIIDRLEVIQPITAPAATLANFGARQWIDQFDKVVDKLEPVNTEPPPKRRLPRRKPAPEMPEGVHEVDGENIKLDPPTYTFDAKEDSELVQVPTEESDW